MDKIQKEKQFHNKIFKDKSRNVTDKFYSITKSSRTCYVDILKNNCHGKRSLEYGCGPGSSAVLLAKNGSVVNGIDISEEAIDLAKKIASQENYDVDLQVMNAEELTFSEDMFHLICGSGILHHLQLEKAFSEISRTLQPSGKAVFLEPLGHNPVINAYRHITPALRTEDEHPLLMSDLKLAHNYFENIEIYYFHLCTLGLIPFRELSIFTTLLNFLDGLDRKIFTHIPYLRKYAWSAVMIFSNPIKERD